MGIRRDPREREEQDLATPLLARIVRKSWNSGSTPQKVLVKTSARFNQQIPNYLTYIAAHERAVLKQLFQLKQSSRHERKRGTRPGNSITCKDRSQVLELRVDLTKVLVKTSVSFNKQTPNYLTHVAAHEHAVYKQLFKLKQSP